MGISQETQTPWPMVIGTPNVRTYGTQTMERNPDEVPKRNFEELADTKNNHLSEQSEQSQPYQDAYRAMVPKDERQNLQKNTGHRTDLTPEEALNKKADMKVNSAAETKPPNILNQVKMRFRQPIIGKLDEAAEATSIHISHLDAVPNAANCKPCQNISDNMVPMPPHSERKSKLDQSAEQNQKIKPQPRAMRAQNSCLMGVYGDHWGNSSIFSSLSARKRQPWRKTASLRS